MVGGKTDGVERTDDILRGLPQVRIGYHTGPRNGYGNTKARTEPSAANRGAAKLGLTEKPPASAGEYVTARM